MASLDVKTRKARKHNFSASEIDVLTDKVEENIKVLQSKFTNSVTNQRKNELWREITAAVNAVGVESRSITEVREKWKSLHSAAKKVFAGFRKESKKTGGGSAPKSPTVSCTRIMDLFKDEPSFRGLEGFETTGPEAALPEETATVVVAVEETPAADLCDVVGLGQVGSHAEHAVVTTSPRIKTSREKPKRKINHDDVLEQQYNTLILKQKNLVLKKRKLELEVFILERNAHGEESYNLNATNAVLPLATINISPIRSTIM